jgi:hypothetical protein
MIRAFFENWHTPLGNAVGVNLNGVNPLGSSQNQIILKERTKILQPIPSPDRPISISAWTVAGTFRVGKMKMLLGINSNAQCILCGKV